MSKWSLNAKIYFVLSIFIIASAVISFISLNKMNEMKASMNAVITGAATRVGNSHELKELFFIQLINEKNFILEDSKEGMEAQLKRLISRDDDFKTKQKEALLISTDAGKKDLRNLLEFYNSWWAIDVQIRELAFKDLNADAARLSMTKGRERRLEIEAVLDATIKRNEEFMRQDNLKAEEDFSNSRNLVLGISLFAMIVGISSAFLTLRKLNISISGVIANLTDSSQLVTSASQQIASTADELSSAATEQAASLEETTSSIEEMSSMIQKNADSARRTSDLASNSSASVEKGKVVVTNMIHAISDITDSNNTIQNQINQSNDEIAEIVRVISEIGEKTKVINDIVFQTKLLSFNASVEAARAGDNGKGFAVVAEEVGNLAQMSGNAAKEITEMLDSSILKVQSIVNNSKQKVGTLIIEGKTKVESGTKIALMCGSVLEEIVVSVSSVTGMATEISTACREQALGIQEITKAMNQLDQVTQINAATSQQSASSANELSAQAQALHNAVGVLVDTIKGAGSTQSQTPKVIHIQNKRKTSPKIESIITPTQDDVRFG
jgi:methyl-accepting chemotaxis protein